MSKACLLLSLPHELTCVCICRSTQKKHRVPVQFFSALPLTGPFAADVLFCSSLKNRCISEGYYSFGLLVLVPREILNYGDDEAAGAGYARIYARHLGVGDWDGFGCAQVVSCLMFVYMF